MEIYHTLQASSVTVTLIYVMTRNLTIIKQEIRKSTCAYLCLFLSSRFQWLFIHVTLRLCWYRKWLLSWSALLHSLVKHAVFASWHISCKHKTIYVRHNLHSSRSIRQQVFFYRHAPCFMFRHTRALWRLSFSVAIPHSVLHRHSGPLGGWPRAEWEGV